MMIFAWICLALNKPSIFTLYLIDFGNKWLAFGN
jgi:hypothetical protein